MYNIILILTFLQHFESWHSIKLEHQKKDLWDTHEAFFIIKRS